MVLVSWVVEVLVLKLLLLILKVPTGIVASDAIILVIIESIIILVSVIAILSHTIVMMVVIAPSIGTIHIVVSVIILKHL